MGHSFWLVLCDDLAPIVLLRNGTHKGLAGDNILDRNIGPLSGVVD